MSNTRTFIAVGFVAGFVLAVSIGVDAKPISGGSGGASTWTPFLTVAGDAGVGGNLGVGGMTGTTSLYVTGDAGILGNLSVGGSATVTGTATAGNFSTAGDAGISGNLGVGGSIGAVYGLSSGTLTVASDAGIGGNLSVTGGLTAGNFSTAGDAGVSGYFEVGGNATVIGTMTAGNFSTAGDAGISGNVGIGGALGVTGAATASAFTCSNTTSCVLTSSTTPTGSVDTAIKLTTPAIATTDKAVSVYNSTSEVATVYGDGDLDVLGCNVRDAWLNTNYAATGGTDTVWVLNTSSAFAAADLLYNFQNSGTTVLNIMGDGDLYQPQTTVPLTLASNLSATGGADESVVVYSTADLSASDSALVVKDNSTTTLFSVSGTGGATAIGTVYADALTCTNTTSATITSGTTATGGSDVAFVLACTADLADSDRLVSIKDNGSTEKAYVLGDGAGFFAPSHGELYEDAPSPTTLTLTNEDTFYQWVSTTVGTCSADVTCTADSTDDITVTRAGVYLITFSASYAVSAAAQVIEAALFVEGTVARDCVAPHVSATTDMDAMSKSCIVSLSANDSLTLRFQNTSSAAKDLTIYHVNLSAYRLN